MICEILFIQHLPSEIPSSRLLKTNIIYIYIYSNLLKCPMKNLQKKCQRKNVQEEKLSGA